MVELIWHQNEHIHLVHKREKRIKQMKKSSHRIQGGFVCIVWGGEGALMPNF